MHLCDAEQISAHEDIYECPVVWKGRSSPPSNASAATYTVAPPVSTSALPEVPIIAPGTAAAAEPTASPGNRTPEEDIFVVGVSSDRVDAGDEEEEDNSHPESLDRLSALAARDQGIGQSSWLRRRDLSAEPVYNSSLVQPGSAATDSDLVGVSLPDMMNATTGTMGIFLSEQCVQMIVWPNQM